MVFLFRFVPLAPKGIRFTVILATEGAFSVCCTFAFLFPYHFILSWVSMLLGRRKKIV